ncbi:MAG: MarR family transcriptional regulator [Paracoccaceae bacterium]
MPLSAPRQTFVLRLGELGRGFGLSKSAAQVWACLLSGENPQSAAELAAELGVARSNISAALKELRGLGLLRAAAAPGERQERFTAPDDPAETAAALLAAFRARVVEPVAGAFDALGPGAAPGVGAHGLLAAALGPAMEAALGAAQAGASPAAAPKKKKKKK